MSSYRIISGSRNVITWPIFFGILLIEVGLAAFISSEHFHNLDFYTSFDLMFGGLLLAHGLLKRGIPYRIGWFGTFFGILFLAVGVANYIGGGGYGSAVFFIVLGAVIILAAISRRRWWW
jgi:hypothetical protein